MSDHHGCSVRWSSGRRSDGRITPGGGYRSTTSRRETSGPLPSSPSSPPICGPLGVAASAPFRLGEHHEWCDALGFTTSGVARGGRERDGDPSVACARHPALEGGDVQVLHRSGTGRQGARIVQATSSSGGQRVRPADGCTFLGIKLISSCPVLQFGIRAGGRGWRCSFLAVPTREVAQLRRR